MIKFLVLCICITFISARDYWNIIPKVHFIISFIAIVSSSSDKHKTIFLASKMFSSIKNNTFKQLEYFDQYYNFRKKYETRILPF